MFKKKCVVIMYKNSTITGSTFITGRLVSYATLFLKLRSQLNKGLGGNYVITNVIKL